jgi:hypothetical protein
MTSFLWLVGLLWIGSIVFVAVCMALVKFLTELEDTYD